MLKVRRRGFGWLAVAGLFLLSAVAVSAAGVSKAYRAEQSLTQGAIVSRLSDKEDTVASASADRPGDVVGVVVGLEDSAISLGEADPGTVQVSSDGELELLVSNLGGDIKRDDFLTLSPLNGVAMKAGREPAVVAVALEDFTAQPGETVGTAEVTTQDGAKQTAALGRILVQFEVAANPSLQLTGQLPSVIEEFGAAVAGQPVSSLRLIIALLVLLVTLGISAVLLFSAIRTAISSIGRNPLSRRAVYGGLVQVFVIVGLVLAAGVGTIYVILNI